MCFLHQQGRFYWHYVCTWQLRHWWIGGKCELEEWRALSAVWDVLGSWWRRACHLWNCCQAGGWKLHLVNGYLNTAALCLKPIVAPPLPIPTLFHLSSFILSTPKAREIDLNYIGPVTYGGLNSAGLYHVFTIQNNEVEIFVVGYILFEWNTNTVLRHMSLISV